MNQDYWWFDIDASKTVGKKQMRIINKKYVEDTIGNYLVNPVNRINLKSIPKMIENIEENTKNNMVHDREEDKWDADKEGLFKGFLEDAYSNIMNSDIQSLIEMYIPKDKNLASMWPHLDDFKGEKSYTDPDTEEVELLEGTGIDPQLELHELLDGKSANEFIGEQTQYGVSSKSSAQKKLVNNTRKLTNKEFFGTTPRDDSILGHISVKFKSPKEEYDTNSADEPTNKNYGDIEVNFTLDHTQGTVSKHIFEEAGFTKWSLKDDPGSYGKSIREGGYSLGWNYSNERPSTSSKLTGSKAFDPVSIWYGESKQKEKAREKYLEQLQRENRSFKEEATGKLSGLKGGIKNIQKRIETITKELQSMGDETEERHGVRLPTQTDSTYERYNPLGEVTEEQPDLSPRQKDKVDWKEKLKPRAGQIRPKQERKEGKEVPTTKQDLLDEIKDLKEFIEYLKIAHPEVYKGKRTFAQELKHVKSLTGEPSSKYMGERAEVTKDSLITFDKEYTIKLGADEMKILKEDFIKAYTPIIGDKMDLGEKHENNDSIRDLFETLIKDGRLYNYLARKARITPWRLMKYAIKFTIGWPNLSGRDMLLESHGKVEASKMVSDEVLVKPAQMKSQKQRKHVVLPVTRRSGGHATKTGFSDKKSIEETLGLNEARSWFVDKLIGRNNRLKEAASKIGANLQV